MRPYLNLKVFLVWSVLGLGRSEGADFVGIYVNKESPQRRIEFLSDGRYFKVSFLGESGTYKKEKSTLTCVDKDGDKMDFTLQGRDLVDAEGHH
jgi:hypothetical protein